MTSRLRSLTMVLLLPAALLVGCGGSDDSGDPDGAGDGPALPSSARLTTYFDAVASYDPDRLAEAEEIAADGSPAQQYAAYLTGFSESAVAAGQPVEAAEAESVDGGFRACGGTGKPDECVTWAGLEGKGGQLTDFTVNDVALDESLVDLTSQPPVTSDGLFTVQPGYAYRSPQSGTLFVVVTVSAFDVPLSPLPGIYIEQDVIIDGIPTRAPASVGAGKAVPVVLAFPHAEAAALDGQVTFDLGLGEGRTESIGFGLVDPAT